MINFKRYLKNKYKTLIQNKFPYSHAGQDIFAINLFGKDGTYLEVGAYLPIKNSNTYLLEVNNNWKGISIELDNDLSIYWENNDERNNPIYFEDALSFDYHEKLKLNELPNHINYLSCDIDPPSNTFKVLKIIIESKITFDFISFEHDNYNTKYRDDKKDYQQLAKEFLFNNGYKIAIDNIYPKNKKNRIFETWYIRNDIKFESIDYETWKKMNLKKI